MAGEAVTLNLKHFRMATDLGFPEQILLPYFSLVAKGFLLGELYVKTETYEG